MSTAWIITCTLKICRCFFRFTKRIETKRKTLLANFQKSNNKWTAENMSKKMSLSHSLTYFIRPKLAAVSSHFDRFVFCA